MGALAEWIVQIGYLVLIAGLVELILPDTHIRGAVRLVVGLVVILSVVEPIVRWVGDPGVIDRLTHVVMVEDGLQYVEAGTRLADRSALDATLAWERNMERQLEGLARLVDGVRDAVVDVKVGEQGEIVGVEIGMHASSDVGVGVKSDLLRLVLSFMPVLEPSAIVITDR